MISQHHTKELSKVRVTYLVGGAVDGFPRDESNFFRIGVFDEETAGTSSSSSRWLELNTASLFCERERRKAQVNRERGRLCEREMVCPHFVSFKPLSLGTIDFLFFFLEDDEDDLKRYGPSSTRLCILVHFSIHRGVTILTSFPEDLNLSITLGFPSLHTRWVTLALYEVVNLAPNVSICDRKDSLTSPSSLYIQQHTTHPDRGRGTGDFAFFNSLPLEVVAPLRFL